MKISGAIFDFDGTLFDSMHIWHGVRWKFFDIMGLTLTAEDKKAFEGLHLKESLILAKERFNICETYEELFVKFFGYMRERYLLEAEPKNDIIEFLEKLKSNGIPMGIATATGEFALKAALEKYSMDGYFLCIYSTYTVGAGKTEPLVYDTVLSELGTDKESTWVFEDALYAARTAKENGYNVVGIYDVSEANQEELRSICDIYIHEYRELDVEKM